MDEAEHRIGRGPLEGPRPTRVREQGRAPAGKRHDGGPAGPVVRSGPGAPPTGSRAAAENPGAGETPAARAAGGAAMETEAGEPADAAQVVDAAETVGTAETVSTAVGEGAESGGAGGTVGTVEPPEAGGTGEGARTGEGAVVAGRAETAAEVPSPTAAPDGDRPAPSRDRARDEPREARRDAAPGDVAAHVAAGERSARDASAAVDAVGRPPGDETAGGEARDGGTRDGGAHGGGTRDDRDGDGRAAGDLDRGEEPDDETSAGSGGAPAPRRSAHRWPAWVELPLLVAFGLALVLTTHVFVAQPFVIPSGSMEDTLRVGDRVLVNKLAYRFGDIRRGDVIVFDGAGSFSPEGRSEPDGLIPRAAHGFGSLFGFTNSGETDFVKRVIGIGGDRVVCCDVQGRITVNGVALDETSYLHPGDRPSEQRFDIVVPPGRLWVMGDHRSNSADSRAHLGDPGGGFVPEDRVIGRVQWVIWPLGGIRSVGRPETFSQPGIDARAHPVDRRG